MYPPLGVQQFAEQSARHLRRVIAAKDDAAGLRGKVAGDFQVVADRPDAGRVGGREGLGEIEPLPAIGRRAADAIGPCDAGAMLGSQDSSNNEVAAAVPLALTSEPRQLRAGASGWDRPTSVYRSRYTG